MGKLWSGVVGVLVVVFARVLRFCTIEFNLGLCFCQSARLGHCELGRNGGWLPFLVSKLAYIKR